MASLRIVTIVVVVGLACGHYSHYDIRDYYRYQPRTLAKPAPTTCTPKTPCYDITLNNIWDGQNAFDMTPGLLEKMFNDFNVDLDAFGEITLAFYREKYGLNFRAANRENLRNTSNAVPSDDGTAILMPFVLDRSVRSRVYSATVGERAAFINTPLTGAGYIAITLQERPPAGERNLTVPANSAINHGYIFVDQCPPERDQRLCESSILTPYSPREKIAFQFWSQYYSPMGLAPSRYTFADCVAYHPVWGRGSIHGYGPTREGTDSTLELREIVTWPEHRY